MAGEWFFKMQKKLLFLTPLCQLFFYNFLLVTGWRDIEYPLCKLMSKLMSTPLKAEQII